jgi:DNA-binding HxlR family transcriptional regulator
VSASLRKPHLNCDAFEQLDLSLDPIAIMSDQWTPRILRECFLKVRRIEAFQFYLEIPLPLLIERLSVLVTHGLLRRVCYQEVPLRYEYVLTESGIGFRQTVSLMSPLDDRRLVARRARRSSQALDRGTIFDGIMVCPDCGETLAKETVGRRPEQRAPTGPRRFREKDSLGTFFASTPPGTEDAIAVDPSSSFGFHHSTMNGRWIKTPR